ncbi:TPA: hypothetical protein ACULOE_001907 [Streptococcus agalactiae]
MRTQQSSMVKLTKNMMVIDLMRTTGWSRERVLKALEWLEAEKTVQFSANGSLNLIIFEG